MNRDYIEEECGSVDPMSGAICTFPATHAGDHLDESDPGLKIKWPKEVSEILENGVFAGMTTLTYDWYTDVLDSGDSDD